ncbi:MAG: hypothetical protein COT74_06270 [Bdellovibrionales bacterium CG10_big_fil_rev_8_21_14_0_10_45_34]|nr:MAG: hypothetical protein COT74_06270 [Bdellovibrionales bacterium CG10_big_fil_rev_8_21_14_0_10_45_34]
MKLLAPLAFFYLAFWTGITSGSTQVATTGVEPGLHRIEKSCLLIQQNKSDRLWQHLLVQYSLPSLLELIDSYSDALTRPASELAGIVQLATNPLSIARSFTDKPPSKLIKQLIDVGVRYQEFSIIQKEYGATLKSFACREEVFAKLQSWMALSKNYTRTIGVNIVGSITGLLPLTLTKAGVATIVAAGVGFLIDQTVFGGEISHALEKNTSGKFQNWVMGLSSIEGFRDEAHEIFERSEFSLLTCGQSLYLAAIRECVLDTNSRLSNDGSAQRGLYCKQKLSSRRSTTQFFKKVRSCLEGRQEPTVKR